MGRCPLEGIRAILWGSTGSQAMAILDQGEAAFSTLPEVPMERGLQRQFHEGFGFVDIL